MLRRDDIEIPLRTRALTREQVLARAQVRTGTCGCCGKTARLTKGGAMWDHTYESVGPVCYGNGHRAHNSCFGTGFPPIEASPKVILALVETNERHLAALPDRISAIKLHLMRLKVPKAGEVSRYRRELDRLNKHLMAIPGRIETMKQAIAEWQEQPLPGQHQIAV